ncbi:hypothetical protein ElyMa_004337800 [Elysia marginata]|uniref:Uncharacterized protein n=1 Tax=Elysia marginata TaxID=1093978 RepID=A0AAV4H2J3_9GAST|nr:hypothetical protein ElyMa_004337800 [Elysia marginata]
MSHRTLSRPPNSGAFTSLLTNSAAWPWERTRIFAVASRAGRDLAGCAVTCTAICQTSPAIVGPSSLQSLPLAGMARSCSSDSSTYAGNVQ